MGFPGKYVCFLISPAFCVSLNTCFSVNILFLLKAAVKFKNKYLKSLELQRDGKLDMNYGKNPKNQQTNKTTPKPKKPSK